MSRIARRFFGIQSKECKSCEQNLRAMVELATGENWLPFWNECHMLLRDHDRFASFGVWFPGDAVHGLGVSGLDGDHPLVQEQDSICIAHCSCGPLSVSPSSFGKHK